MAIAIDWDVKNQNKAKLIPVIIITNGTEILHAMKVAKLRELREHIFSIQHRRVWNHVLHNINGLSTRETLPLLLVNNNGVDQAAHPRSLINAFVIRYLKSKVTRRSAIFLVGFNMIKSLATALSFSRVGGMF